MKNDLIIVSRYNNNKANDYFSLGSLFPLGAAYEIIALFHRWVVPLGALWSGIYKNRDVTGPLARPFARSFTRTAHSLARSLTLLTPSLVGK